MIGDIGEQVKQYGSLSRLPMAEVSNVRNDMYIVIRGHSLSGKKRSGEIRCDTKANLKAFKKDIDDATKFIPLWVKVSVAIALGLGTMVGWKRIVVTVGEKIGKSHLTYAQGASAELVAMTTIGAADMFGLPVSTTQVLSSGVAGAMAANKSGLQLSTIRNLATAWVLTLPAGNAVVRLLVLVVFQVVLTRHTEIAVSKNPNRATTGFEQQDCMPKYWTIGRRTGNGNRRPAHGRLVGEATKSD